LDIFLEPLTDFNSLMIDTCKLKILYEEKKI
jgi:hypothetical protein